MHSDVKMTQKLADKDVIRAQALQKRRYLSYNQTDMAEQFLLQFKRHIGFEDINALGFYWALPSEADPRRIAEGYISKHNGGIAALPVMREGDRNMTFYAWQLGDELVVGSGGIQMPIADKNRIVFPDTVIVPLVLVNKNGQRIGFGKGCYDATLASLKQTKSIKTIGLAYDEQVYDGQWLVDEHDVAMDYILTPQCFIKCER